jgi:hypothetical protein
MTQASPDALPPELDERLSPDGRAWLVEAR